MADPTNKQLREFIMRHFDDGEIETFCFEYFPEVRDNFTLGMDKNKKVMDLMDYCRRRRMMDNFLVNLRQEREEPYRAIFTPQQNITPAPAINELQPRNPKQIFICHASQDADFAQRLAKDLQQNGFDTFITPTSIRPGEKWVPAINRGLEESGIFSVLLTPHAVQSGWVQDETNTAIALANGGKARLYLLDVAPCRVPILWQQRQLLPFRNKAYKQDLQTLLAELNGVNPPVEVPQPETQTVAEIVEVYIQAMPAWLKWGGGLVLALLIIMGTGNAILGNGDDNKPTVTPVLSTVVPATAPMIIAEVTTRSTEEPTATIDANIPPQDVALGNSLQRPTDSMAMVYVPSGSFLMGSDDGEDEQPIHEVILDAFWIDRTEVTNEQYELCVVDGKCEISDYASDNDFNDDQQPVVGVSWNDAAVYCTWVGARLPTEAEWEYAARGSEGNTYPWGYESPTCDLLNYDRCTGKTTAVSSYSPEGDSWVGASDMAGNVWEWVNDWYDSDYYSNSDADNPAGPQTGDRKVLRGGSWFYIALDSRSSNRYVLTPTIRFNSFGFRCAAPGK